MYNRLYAPDWPERLRSGRRPRQVGYGGEGERRGYDRSIADRAIVPVVVMLVAGLVIMRASRLVRLACGFAFVTQGRVRGGHGEKAATVMSREVVYVRRGRDAQGYVSRENDPRQTRPQLAQTAHEGDQSAFGQTLQ